MSNHIPNPRKLTTVSFSIDASNEPHVSLKVFVNGVLHEEKLFGDICMALYWIGNTLRNDQTFACQHPKEGNKS